MSPRESRGEVRRRTRVQGGSPFVSVLAEKEATLNRILRFTFVRLLAATGAQPVPGSYRCQVKQS